MQRYLKKNSSQTLIFSGAIETTSETNLEEMALNQEGVLSDYTIGIEEDDVIQGWWEAQDEARKTYSDRRKESYPPATDYLDGIVKGDQAQIDKYVADCLAVKQRHPK